MSGFVAGRGWGLVLCVCGSRWRRRRVRAHRAARTTSVVRAGGVSDGSRPSVRRAPRRRPLPSSNLQRCRVAASEQLRAQSVARRFVSARSVRVWESFGRHSPLMCSQPRPFIWRAGLVKARASTSASRKTRHPLPEGSAATLRTPPGLWVACLFVAAPTAARTAGSLPQALRRDATPPQRRHRRGPQHTTTI